MGKVAENDNWITAEAVCFRAKYAKGQATENLAHANEHSTEANVLLRAVSRVDQIVGVANGGAVDDAEECQLNTCVGNTITTTTTTAAL